MVQFALLFLPVSTVAANMEIMMSFISPYSDELRDGTTLIDKGSIANFSSLVSSGWPCLWKLFT